MRKEKTLSPESGHPNRWRNSRIICPQPSLNWKSFARPSSAISKTSRTSSSRSKKAKCSCSRRATASGQDLRGMIAAEGILTAKGGVSSHAALVARQMGKVCVCGASALQIDYAGRTMTVDGRIYKEGDYISINGTAGEVYPGELKTAASEIVQVLVERSLQSKESV